MPNKHSKTQDSLPVTLNIDPPADAQEQGELYSCYFIALVIISPKQGVVNSIFPLFYRKNTVFSLSLIYHKNRSFSTVFLVINMEKIAKTISITLLWRQIL